MRFKYSPEKLKKARRNAVLSQDDVADALRVSKRTVSNWECGNNEPRAEDFMNMAVLYGIRPEALMGREDEPKNS